MRKREQERVRGEIERGDRERVKRERERKG